MFWQSSGQQSPSGGLFGVCAGFVLKPVLAGASRWDVPLPSPSPVGAGSAGGGGCAWSVSPVLPWVLPGSRLGVNRSRGRHPYPKMGCFPLHLCYCGWLQVSPEQTQDKLPLLQSYVSTCRMFWNGYFTLNSCPILFQNIFPCGGALSWGLRLLPYRR